MGEELDFARGLLQELTAGLPADRLALHICRGNWTPDEAQALAGDYRPLIPLLSSLEFGTFVLEICTPRAGEIEILTTLPTDRRIGVGLVNQKNRTVDTVEAVTNRARRAVELFGAERLLLNPDCGFATFADNPIVTADVAEAHLAVLAGARDCLAGD